MATTKPNYKSTSTGAASVYATNMEALLGNMTPEEKAKAIKNYIAANPNINDTYPGAKEEWTKMANYYAGEPASSITDAKTIPEKIEAYKTYLKDNPDDTDIKSKFTDYIKSVYKNIYPNYPDNYWNTKALTELDDLEKVRLEKISDTIAKKLPDASDKEKQIQTEAASNNLNDYTTLLSNVPTATEELTPEQKDAANKKLQSTLGTSTEKTSEELLKSLPESLQKTSIAPSTKSITEFKPGEAIGAYRKMDYTLPTNPWRTEQPATQNPVTQQPAGQTTGQQPPALPINPWRTQQPVTQQPVTQQPVTQQPAGQTTGQQPTEQATVKIPTPQQPAGQTTGQQPAGQTTGQQPAGQTTGQKPLTFSSPEELTSALHNLANTIGVKDISSFMKETGNLLKQVMPNNSLVSKAFSDTTTQPTGGIPTLPTTDKPTTTQPTTTQPTGGIPTLPTTDKPTTTQPTTTQPITAQPTTPTKDSNGGIASGLSNANEIEKAIEPPKPEGSNLLSAPIFNTDAFKRAPLVNPDDLSQTEYNMFTDPNLNLTSTWSNGQITQPKQVSNGILSLPVNQPAQSTKPFSYYEHDNY